MKLIFLFLAVSLIGIIVYYEHSETNEMQGTQNRFTADKKTADSSATIKVYSTEKKEFIMTEKITKTDEEWKEQLTEEQFYVTRKAGTERAFSGKYWNNHEEGTYKCVCCGNDLFVSETKFESGTGWPSFYKPVADENVSTKTDKSHFMVRSEVVCAKCGAHLGHLFDDGPEPTGLRYCMNSASLKFEKK